MKYHGVRGWVVWPLVPPAWRAWPKAQGSARSQEEAYPPIRAITVAKILRTRSQKVGLPPATLVPMGKMRAEPVRITVMDYDESRFLEKEIQDIDEVLPFKNSPTVTWINIDGLQDIGILEKIGRYFDIHPLILEDIVTTDQRPKIEESEDYAYIVLRMVYCDESNELVSEQVSLVVASNFVISFQERVGDVFDPIRDRIRTGKGRVRTMGPDYLVYVLMDAIVDNYFVILETLTDRIEDLEEKLVTDPTPEVLRMIHRSKRDLIYLRKSVWPLREVISRLERGESRIVRKTTQIYLRDVYDHTIHIIDTVETLRDMVTGMLDIYLSSISNRMNEIMKVLTIMATIFIPLTFIAGLYGMNFHYMPELDTRWGYPLVLIAMLFVALIMLAYFRGKRWL